jgi:chromosome segregation ATPase
MTDQRDEIERLKAQLENLSESHLGQRVLIAAMSEERDGMKRLVEQATVEIERLRKERDDAREQAERWEDDALRLLNERNAAQRERDEARREVCYASTQPPRECAEDRGWDCYKEDGK